MRERLSEQEQLNGLMSDNGYPYPSKTELLNIFVSSCVEAAARKENISTTEMYKRMKAVDLFKQFIYPCYETLHTQSRDIVTEDVLEALKNRETHKVQTK
jgi:hypothetical protein